MTDMAVGRVDRTELLRDLKPPTRAGRFARFVKLGALLLLALAAIGGTVYWFSSQPANGPAFVTEPAARGDLKVLVTANGSVQPIDEVEVSSELSGTVRRVLVDYNSAVKRGQALAELDTDKLRAVVESSRAKLAAAQASVKEAEATLLQTRREQERKSTLAEKRIGSLQDLDTAAAAYERALATVDSAKAQVAVAQAQLQLDELNLSKACICSPIDGVVLSRNVDPGQTVAASLQAPVLFTLADDLRRMEVEVDVDEADVGRVRAGQSARFTVDAYPDREFPATIRDVRFASEVVQGVVTYKAVLTVDNSELLLRPGMTATAEILVEEVKDALLVPNTALRFTPPVTEQPQRSFLQRLLPGMPSFRAASPRKSAGPSRQVYVLQDGQPVQVPVTVGATDGARTQVLGGALTAGQPVITGTAKTQR